MKVKFLYKKTAPTAVEAVFISSVVNIVNNVIIVNNQ